MGRSWLDLNWEIIKDDYNIYVTMIQSHFLYASSTRIIHIYLLDFNSLLENLYLELISNNSLDIQRKSGYLKIDINMCWVCFICHESALMETITPITSHSQFIAIKVQHSSALYLPHIHFSLESQFIVGNYC